MIYNKLGDSGVMVSRLSYGTWETFSTKFEMPLAKDMLAYAYEQGVNFFDNAEVYGDGRSEELMGKALKELNWERSTYMVSSKVFWGGKRPTQLGLSRKHVIEACEKALVRFGLDYLDLYYCHRPDADTPILETVRAMDHLVRQGKVLYWGTSEWDADQITEAFLLAEMHGLTPPTMEQPQYNLFERQRVEKDYRRLYKRFGLGLTTWSPLCSGLLTGKYNYGIPENSRLSLEHLEWLKQHFMNDQRDLLGKARRLEEIAKQMGVPFSQMAIAWCLKNEHVSSVLLGASNIEQLQENLGALQLIEKLTSEVLERIEKIVENRPMEVPNFKEL